MKYHLDNNGEELLDDNDLPIPIHECICGADDPYACECGAHDAYITHIGLAYIEDENDYN